MLDADEHLVGVLAFSDLLAAHQSASPINAGELARQPIVAFADETLREAADRMVSSGHGVLPVTDRGTLSGWWDWSASSTCSRRTSGC